MPPVLQKNERRSVYMDNVVAGKNKTRSFCVTTTAGENETSEGNPENIKRDAVDVAPSAPAPEDEAATEPTPDNEAAAEPTTMEPTTAEPARRGPVVQELDLTRENPTDRARFQLCTLPTELRTRIIHHGPCRKEPFAISSENGNIHIFSQKNPLPCTFWSNINRTAMALLLANDEEAIFSKMLVVR